MLFGDGGMEKNTIADTFVPAKQVGGLTMEVKSVNLFIIFVLEKDPDSLGLASIGRFGPLHFNTFVHQSSVDILLQQSGWLEVGLFLDELGSILFFANLHFIVSVLYYSRFDCFWLVVLGLVVGFRFLGLSVLSVI